MMFGVLINSVPTAFWLTSFIFASPALLSAIRAEVDACCVGDASHRIINTTKLLKSCPTFLVTISEVLRIAAPIHISRLVLEDTIVTLPSIGRSFFLAKGNVVQIATSVIHSQHDIWGDDAKTFRPERFLPPVEEDTKSCTSARTKADISRPELPSGMDRGSWRSFGGGNNLCPGRHFAQMGIMSLVGLLVAGYEISAPDNSAMRPPPFGSSLTMASTLKPSEDVKVKVKRREALNKCEWRFEP